MGCLVGSGHRRVRRGMGRQPRRPRKLWALALAGQRSRRNQHSVLACGDYVGVGGEVSEWGAGWVKSGLIDNDFFLCAQCGEFLFL